MKIFYSLSREPLRKKENQELIEESAYLQKKLVTKAIELIETDQKSRLFIFAALVKEMGIALRGKHEIKGAAARRWPEAWSEIQIWIDRMYNPSIHTRTRFRKDSPNKLSLSKDIISSIGRIKKIEKELKSRLIRLIKLCLTHQKQIENLFCLLEENQVPFSKDAWKKIKMVCTKPEFLEYLKKWELKLSYSAESFDNTEEFQKTEKNEIYVRLPLSYVILLHQSLLTIRVD